MFKFTHHQLIAAYVIVGVALAGIIVLALRPGQIRPDGEVRIIEPSGAATIPATTDVPPPAPEKPCVHVAGRVKKPGLYELEPGSRIKDAIQAAGGGLPNADLDSINLAEKIEDGQQIYVARLGQVKPPAVSVVRGGKTAKPAKGETAKAGAKASEPAKLSKPGEGTVSINSAGLDELQRLPGIGPAYAQRIIDYRTEHGRFQSVDELDEVKGIGPKKLEKLRPFVKL